MSHYPFAGDGKIYDNFGSTARKDNLTSAITLLNTWHRLRIHSAVNDWGMYQNNSTVHTTATNTVGFSASPRIGSNGSQAIKGDIATVYLFSAKLTAGQISDMAAYINAKYGV